ncbi:DUF2790 domain-containing protein [Pseudomonas monteilii]|uniref:DUF2790 domain-containing protein n=1 Tax=Pseudomonas monteilii TaxID=76759 RepID=A0A399M6J3_9PSED|nr:DUF2790 domain-containing protein [Pseudomonas monteilii]RII77408.1 DUF2790 domain-containing protein [Pseudomonas monteilii]
MKNVLIPLLGVLMVTSVCAAQHNTAVVTEPAVTEYQYGQNLDIARVLSHSKIPPVCYVVPVEMTYEDSQGNQHTIRYRAMGTGCLNG